MLLKIDGGLFTYDFIDHHAILCVPVDAEFKEIRNRYLQIARILHPDSSSVVGEPAKEIANQLLAKLVNPAYEKFSVEQNRHEYLFVLSQMGKRFAQEPETIKLKTELAKQLLASPNITTLYKEAIAKIAKTQFSDFQQVPKIIAQVSELNLVYLMWVAKRSINQPSTQPENSPQKLQSTPTLPSQAESAVGEYLQRAQNLLEINQLLQAKVELQDALKLEPQNSRCHSLMAMVYLRNNQLKMAKIHFDHALKLDPKEKIALEWKPKVDQALGGNNSVNKEKQIDKPENRRWFPNLFDEKKK